MSSITAWPHFYYNMVNTKVHYCVLTHYLMHGKRSKVRYKIDPCIDYMNTMTSKFK